MAKWPLHKFVPALISGLLLWGCGGAGGEQQVVVEDTGGSEDAVYSTDLAPSRDQISEPETSKPDVAELVSPEVGHGVDGHGADPCADVDCAGLGACEVRDERPFCTCAQGYEDDGAGGCQRSPAAWSEGVAGQALVAADVAVLTAAAATEVQATDDELRMPASLYDSAIGRTPPFVLVSASGPGFLRYVRATRSEGDDIVLEAAETSLARVFDDAEITMDLPFTPVTSGAKTDGAWVDVDLADYVLYDGALGDATVKVTVVRGHLRIAPRFGLDYSVRFGSLRHLKFRLDGELSAGLELSVEATGGLPVWAPSESIPLAGTAITVLVAGVPVVFTPYLSLELGLEDVQLTGCGQFSAGAALASQVSATVEYSASEGGWSATEISDFQVEPYTPRFDLKLMGGEATSFVRLRLGVDVYNVAGPYFEFGPWARFGFAYSTPWQIEVGVGAAIGVHASAFGWDIADYSRSVFDFGEIAATGAPPCDEEALALCPSYWSGLDGVAQCLNEHVANSPGYDLCAADRKAAFALEIHDCMLAAGCYTRVGSTTAGALSCAEDCWGALRTCALAYAGDPDCASCYTAHSGDCHMAASGCESACMQGGYCRDYP